MSSLRGKFMCFLKLVLEFNNHPGNVPGQLAWTLSSIKMIGIWLQPADPPTNFIETLITKLMRKKPQHLVKSSTNQLILIKQKQRSTLAPEPSHHLDSSLSPFLSPLPRTSHEIEDFNLGGGSLFSAAVHSMLIKLNSCP